MTRVTPASSWSCGRPAVVIAGQLIAALAVAASCARGPDPWEGVDPTLVAAIAEVEEGRRTTPLIEQPAPGSQAEVTFLVNSPGGSATRIVSDVTGWGESPDDSSST